MHEIDIRAITGIEIIPNKKFKPKTVKPRYSLNKITRKLEVENIEVSEDVYNALKTRYQKNL